MLTDRRLENLIVKAAEFQKGCIDVADTFYVTESGHYRSACFGGFTRYIGLAGKVPDVIGVIPPIDFFHKETEAGKKYFEFLVGSDSPWINYKHLLFPDGPKFVKEIGSEAAASIDIWSNDFRRTSGHFLFDFKIPINLYFNFFKAIRSTWEHPQVTNLFDLYLQGGLTPRQSFWFATHSYIDRGGVNPNFAQRGSYKKTFKFDPKHFVSFGVLNHSCFNSAAEIHQYQSIIESSLNTKRFLPLITEQPDSFYPCDAIWDKDFEGYGDYINTGRQLSHLAEYLQSINSKGKSNLLVNSITNEEFRSNKCTFSFGFLVENIQKIHEFLMNYSHKEKGK